MPKQLLIDHFSEAGKVVAVETGFPGFAFVEYEDERDSDKACDLLHRSMCPGVGEVVVNRATTRGYEEAVWKRKSFLEKHNRETGSGQGRDRDSTPHKPRCRSRSDWRRSKSRKSRSRSSRRRSRSTRCGSRRRSASEASSVSPSRYPQRASPSREALRSKASRNSVSPRSGSPRGRVNGVHYGDQPVGGTEGESERGPSASFRSAALAGVLPATTATDGATETAIVPQTSCEVLALPDDAEGQLSCDDRTAAVCFFDGTSLSDLLLEAGAVVKLPHLHLAELLEGFPQGFVGLSQDAKVRLLHVLARFITAGAQVATPGAEASLEIRQTVIIDSRGRRVIRKSLVINKQEACSEEHALRQSSSAAL